MTKDHVHDPDSKGATSKPQRRVFGWIPNSVVLDTRLSDRALALLAYRLTKVGKFALSIDAAAIGLPLSDGSKGRKIGRTQFKCLIVNLTGVGYLERRQPPGRGRASFNYVVETVHVPDGEIGVRICYEWWHDGSLSPKAIAGLLFIRAHNCPVHQAALRARFGWGRDGVRKVVLELLEAELIIRVPGAKPTYRDSEVHNSVEGQKPNSAETTLEKPTLEKPSNDKPSHTRNDRFPRNDKGHEKDQAPHRSYGSVDKATKPGPLSDHGWRSCESRLSDPWESNKVLGWAAKDEDGLNARLSLNELSRDTEAEVEAVLSEDQIIDRVHLAAEGRVHSDILSPAGAMAIRLLASVLVEDKGHTAQQAVDEILSYIEERFGARSEWLNSLKLVAIRVAGSTAGGEQGLHSATKAMLGDLRAADVNGILGPDLFRQPRQLKRLCKKYGEEAVDVIRRGINVATVDGKVPGSIKTWDYFEPTLQDERLARRMAEEGMRPGDVFGFHRELGEGDEPH